MTRSFENPDRNFSAAPSDAREGTDLRDLIKRNEVADIFDPVVRQRVGELIGRWGFDPSKA
jgi:hypothetical protein